jgi:hypothetical protein
MKMKRKYLLIIFALTPPEGGWAWSLLLSVVTAIVEEVIREYYRSKGSK